MAIADYLNALDRDKQTLVENLNAQGVAADNSETFTTLAPKVLDIATGEPVYRWKISVANELPATANDLDIVLIPIEGAAAINATKIKTVAIYANLAPEKGNIYPDNTISLFEATAGTAGTGELYLNLGTFTMETPVIVGDSVINVDGEQVEYTPYIYSGGQWVEAPYFELPTIVNELISIDDYIGSYVAPDFIQLLGLNDEATSESAQVEPLQETIDISDYIGTYTAPDFIALLNLAESAKYAKNNGEEIPIT